MLKLAILQPFIPHYRSDFFKGIGLKHTTKIYCYDAANVSKHSFKKSGINYKSIRNVALGPFLIYNPLDLFSEKYDILVLMLHFGHVTTWFLLITKFIHKKKIILWGQGISVKRYLKEEKRPSTLLKWMIALSDGIWLYTTKEKKQWQSIFPKKEIISLNNTISGVERILSYKSPISRQELKEKYKITQQTCLLFCARFNNNYRRVDLLLKTINCLDPETHAFIIIGEGPVKPDFKKYKNVYDFGAVYDSTVKDDLFTMADIYFQPGWVGLSVVEALAYGLPIFTFKRSNQIQQCVEYSYLIENHNAFLFDSVEELKTKLLQIGESEIKQMSKNSHQYVSKNLLMENMIANACNIEFPSSIQNKSKGL